ncbi:MAG TPA: PKD domain-containing protein [Thermoplasmata archaeon]|nr:PKD domain-containing protein [Thermoplasmata archaeon]
MIDRTPRAAAGSAAVPRLLALGLLVGGLLSLGGCGGTGASGGVAGQAWAPDGAGAPAWSLSVAAVVDAPMLSLVPTPEVGNAPFNVNVSVSVSGGVAPYTLSVCFGTADHSSPPPNCGGTISGWIPSGPLVYSHLYPTPGNFSVVGVVTDAHGAGAGSTALIVATSGSALAANAQETASQGRAPLTVEFTGTVSGGTPPLALQWIFGDGASGSELPTVPVRHVYSNAGVYHPTLRVMDGAGHLSVQALPAVTVGPATTGPALFDLAGPFGPLILASAVFLVVASVIGVLARVRENQRLRREGNQLIERMREGRSASEPSPPSP